MNNITENKKIGIAISYSSNNNVIDRNIISRNIDQGIWIFDSIDNNILRNDIKEKGGS